MRALNSEIVVALISLVGVIVTVYFGNKKTEKSIKSQGDLTLYRIDQLEKKQDKHNGIIERVYQLEKEKAILEEEIKVANHRIADLEEFHR